MSALKIIGCAVVGGAAGFCAGLWAGDREGGGEMLNFAPAIYGPFGGMLGGLVGVIVGAVLFS